mmetsp:Transcript_20062/g.30839  ORF Transcript_20062/g.30839 Transcript_20062/m.30839 type:complete len:114 (+) Transcript_20062:1449-1790(+)
MAGSPQAPVTPTLDIQNPGFRRPSIAKPLGGHGNNNDNPVSVVEVGSGTEDGYTWVSISTPSQSPDINAMKSSVDKPEENSKGSPASLNPPPISVSAELREKTKRTESQKTKP